MAVKDWPQPPEQVACWRSAVCWIATFFSLPVVLRSDSGADTETGWTDWYLSLESSD